MNDHGRVRPVSLYLHFPFCVRKCRYCDFLSGPASEERREEYISLLCREISLRAGCLRYSDPDPGESGSTVDTIFIGGGTPSLMTPEQLQRVMDSLRSHFRIEDDAEISMEVNPGTADFEKLSAYRKAGVNRLSIGVQSFDDSELQLLGRIHTAEQARETFRAARRAGFSNLNLDLMSALPGQSLESWSRTLREAASLQPEHLSAYSLIIEEGTPFAALYDSGHLKDLPSEEEDRAIYHYTGDFLAENGYLRYEISNYAKEGYACRHNCGYWTGHEYLGLGLGASSDLGGERFHNPFDPNEYREAVSEGENLRRERQEMTREDRMEEFMFLGLRMTEGVSERAFQERFGCALEDVFGDVIRRHISQGVISKMGCGEDIRIALTQYGLDVANHVMAEYLL